VGGILDLHIEFFSLEKRETKGVSEFN
jgi:hypothetical protein